tara:strand:- start:4455 stop:6005 length:1551 start_codon:yes stop_codon:yes gene_type:complete
MFPEINTGIMQIIQFAAFQPIITKLLENESTIYYIIMSSPIILIFIVWFCFDYNVLYKEILLRFYYANFFSRPAELEIAGERYLKHCNYTTKSSILTSELFNALWDYTITNMNKDIYAIKEWKTFQVESEYYDDNVTDNKFVINQISPIYIEDDIHLLVKTVTNKIEIQCGYSKTDVDQEKIILTLFSYNKDVYYLKNFLSNLHKKYQIKKDKERQGKLFHYYLNDINEGDCIWKESHYESSKTFENLFFDGKKDTIKRIDFFLNNKDYYYKWGVPYTLGIGLHGPPGTGKTSFIKALANKTKRHIITISLNRIKTENDFMNAFSASLRCNDETKKYLFKDVIIVLEDIDCMSEIVFERKNETENEIETQIEEDPIKNKDKLKDMIKDVISGKSIDDTYKKSPQTENKITLSFILNVIDGVRENPGRILVITSNHYEKLDTALTRPGRVDLTLEMKNASIPLIKTMYKHFFSVSFPKQYLGKLRDDVVSPCELINYRFKSKNSSDFLKFLLNKMEA